MKFRQLVYIFNLILDQVPPAEAEYQEDRLAHGIKHSSIRSAQLAAHSQGVIDRVHSIGQEIAEDGNDVSCALPVDEGGTADETGDVA